MTLSGKPDKLKARRRSRPWEATQDPTEEALKQVVMVGTFVKSRRTFVKSRYAIHVVFEFRLPKNARVGPGLAAAEAARGGRGGGGGELA